MDLTFNETSTRTKESPKTSVVDLTPAVVTFIRYRAFASFNELERVSRLEHKVPVVDFAQKLALRHVGLERLD